MGLWNRLFGQAPADTADTEDDRPRLVDVPIPHTLDLGWYWSENKDEWQLAKVADSDRATHCYVIGASGAGKTKFLEFLIQQDIEKGNGFGVIDPHGDLIEEIKGLLACRYMTFEEMDEVATRTVLVDPTDPAQTVSFNPLERLPTVSVPEQVAELISSFKKIWSDSWGIRMEDLMRNALISLGEANLTLLELPPFLTNRPFRRMVLERVSHPIAQDYFRTRFDQMTDRGQVTWIEPVMNKINAFLSDPRIRQMFAAGRSTFNVREVMDSGKMLLVKLDKGKLKDSSDLLGSLIMAKIMMAAFSRSDVSPSKRRPFYLYIDEFQNFATDSFSTVLSEARKYGLSLVMAHQTLAQIPEELRSLILGNAGIQVCFRVNRHDAAMLAKEAFKYSGFEVKQVTGARPTYWSFAEEWEHKTEDLRDLPPRTCFVKHKIQGGLIPLQTVEMVPATDVLDMTEDEYHRFLHEIPFGHDYLVSRSDLTERANERAAWVREQGKQVAEPQVRTKPEPRAKQPPKPAPTPAPVVAPEPEIVLATPPTEVAEPEITEPHISPEVARPPRIQRPKPEKPKVEGKGGTQHKYLQALIKRMAEDRGFKATIEQSVPDGGLVDVGIERDKLRIACEITLTTPATHELGNVEKCLAAGYQEVIVCSPEKRSLDKARTVILDGVAEANRDRVLFMKPEELLFHLDGHAARRKSKEQRVKGYKVKVNYQPVEDEAVQAAKREAVAQVIVGTFRKLKNVD